MSGIYQYIQIYAFMNKEISQLCFMKSKHNRAN